MDYILRKFGDVGEIGLDSEVDTDFGRFYVKLYDGTVDLCGYDTEEEAQDEMLYILSRKENV
jgi:hypothetical protein